MAFEVNSWMIIAYLGGAIGFALFLASIIYPIFAQKRLILVLSDPSKLSVFIDTLKKVVIDELETTLIDKIGTLIDAKMSKEVGLPSIEEYLTNVIADKFTDFGNALIERLRLNFEATKGNVVKSIMGEGNQQLDAMAIPGIAKAVEDHPWLTALAYMIAGRSGIPTENFPESAKQTVAMMEALKEGATKGTGSGSGLAGSI